MKHLTDEQLEQLLQQTDLYAEHLKQCPQCTQRLEEKKAIADRLHVAFDNVTAPANLAQKISLQISPSESPKNGYHTIHLSSLRSHWKSLSTIAAAAIILIVCIPIGYRLTNPSPAAAAQAELARIHEHNLSGNHKFYSESDPEKLAQYFKEKLGFAPSIPMPSQGMELMGCCVRHFRERIAGSYVVETEKGIISVIVVTDEPESLGMAKKPPNGHPFWESSFAKCKMVSVRLGEYTYCAVGDVPHKYLTELLEKLVPKS